MICPECFTVMKEYENEPGDDYYKCPYCYLSIDKVVE